ncbi:MAG: B12-binding domain-containing radical SAM protein [Actinobacteria bacterium]|nr:B12-binding domain-containing radical SAM protein [Actinomycetota bacterium]
MKIKLIAPAKKPEWGEAFWDLKKICKLAGAKANNAPLSLLTVAALTPGEFEVEIVDENVRTINYDEAVDLVGLTSFTSHAPRAYEIADEFRRRGVTVVMGGIHASMLPEEALEHCDSVVVGEAEGLWPHLLGDFGKGDLKQFYEQEKFINLSDSPLPRWDLVDEKDYLGLTVQTSRGCPNNCNFCSVTSFNGRRVRHKAIDAVIKEVERLKELNPKKIIFFTDDNLMADRAYALKLFDGLRELRIEWWCQASINKLDDDNALRRMYEAGCRQIFIGFESVSQTSLSYLNKSKVNKLVNYKKVIEKVHAHAIAICGSFMMGSDGDPEGIFGDTFNFIDECNLSYAMINIITPTPGTVLFEKLKSEDRITCPDWQKYDGENVCFRPSSVDTEELLLERNKLLKKLYDKRQLSKRLDRLLDRGVFTRKEAGLVTRDRLLATLSILTVTPRNWPFIINSLWDRRRASVGSVLMSLSFGEYSRRL